MEFLRIEQSDKSRWNKVWELYESSFPTAERRKMKDHVRACSDPQFHPISAWEDGELIGLLFYWEWDMYRYLEYLAIAPGLRGHGFGSQLLRYLRDSDHTIILEIDPLINELSVRRLQFDLPSHLTGLCTCLTGWKDNPLSCLSSVTRK